MGELLDFRRPEPKDPHIQGPARCLGCGYGWQAVAPAGTVKLDCPLCGAPKGRFVEVVALPEGTLRWVCQCEGEIFYVLENSMICVNCGKEHDK